MKYIITILKKLLPKDLPKPVGRWRIEECYTKMNHKVDLSNEDHCGPCGQYALDKIGGTPGSLNDAKRRKVEGREAAFVPLPPPGPSGRKSSTFHRE